MTEKLKQIIEVEMPVAEAADMMTKAAAAGVSLEHFVKVHALQGVYGVFHPVVIAFRNRPKPGICGPQTQDEV